MRSAREAAFDVVKGISILEVMIHHSTSHSARKYTIEGSMEWWSLMVVNRLLHFAVPVFMFVSALLLARSLNKAPKPDWKRFAIRRIARTAWPYVLWTVAYILFRVFVMGTASDTDPWVVSLPNGFTTLAPRLLVDSNAWTQALLWGRGYFHLYFMSILLQLAIVFPILLAAMKRIKRLTTAALLAGSCQVAVYLLQAYWWRFPTPGSMILWYLPAVMLGAWAGLNWSQFRESVDQVWPWVLGVTSVGCVVSLTLSIRLLMDLPVPTIPYNFAMAVYSAGIALILVQLGGRIHETRWGPSLAKVGQISIVLFLIHPMLLYFVGGPRISGAIDWLPGSAFWSFCLLFGATLALAKLLIWLKVDVLLFGQRFPAQTAPAPATATAA